MSPLINLAMIGCLTLALLLAIFDHVRRPSWRRLLISVLALGTVALALFLTTGFPFTPPRQAFGGTSPLLALALMFAGVVLGIAGEYIYNLRGTFSWLDLARGLVWSPILLIPLFSSLQAVADLEPVQLLWFWALAFQNGFLWRQVARDAKPKT